MAIFLFGGLAIAAIFALLFMIEIAAWLIVIAVVGGIGLVLWYAIGPETVGVLIVLALAVTACIWVAGRLIKMGCDRNHPVGRQVAARLQDAGILRRRVGAGIDKALPRGWMLGDVIVGGLILYVIGGMVLVGIVGW